MPDAGSLDRATRQAAAEVERELSRVLPKESFKRMRILGQFNLGFIIARSSRLGPQRVESRRREVRAVRDPPIRTPREETRTATTMTRARTRMKRATKMAVAERYRLDGG